MQVSYECGQRQILSILANPRKILCFPSKGWLRSTWWPNGVTWHPVSHTRAAQWGIGQKVWNKWLGKEGELKNTGCLSIQFFLREFYQEWAQQSFILFCFILFFKGWGGGSGVVVEGARRLESFKNSSSFFGARNFHFLNFFGVDFFIFLSLDLKSAQLAPYITTLYHVCLIINTCQSLNLLIPYKQWSKAIRWDS